MTDRTDKTNLVLLGFYKDSKSGIIWRVKDKRIVKNQGHTLFK